MKLKWSAYALSDRDDIFSHIEKESPRAAVSVDDRIAGATGHLIDYPESGRIGRVPGTRELIVSGTPYIAAYTLNEDTVRILRVLHGAMQWPDILTSEDDDR